jgi:hypothetical protein
VQANVFQQLDAGLPGQLLVGQDDVDRPLGQDGPCGLTGIGRDQVELFAE